jgi:antirestriction protein
MKANSVEPRIYVASLTDYNNGILHGEWIDLSGKTVEDVQDEIKAMLATSPAAAKYGDIAEEYAIHDYELEGISISEYESIEKVVRISELLEEHGEAFAIWLAYRGDLEDADKTFEEAYMGQWGSLREYAEQTFDECNDIPDHLARYIDYEKVERDYSFDHMEQDGHVFRTDI